MISETTQVVTATEVFLIISQGRRPRHTQVVTATKYHGTSVREGEGEGKGKG